MMKRLWTLIAALLSVQSAQARTETAEGRWAARAGGQPVMILSLTHDETGWHGWWRLPAGFTSDSTFSTLEDTHGPAVDQMLVSAREEGDALDLRFARKPGGDTDGYRFTVSPEGIARMTSRDVPTATLVFDRARPDETVIAYDPTASYRLDQHWPTNAEMTAIFTADQADRDAGAAIDWAVVGPRDDARRRRARELLETGALHSGEDFYHAAFVFQHGSQPGDYLLAHALATVAMARGETAGAWIAAATLDRYLQNIGQPQIYGTQFSSRREKIDGTPAGPMRTTQEPYDRTLIPDALRAATGVPALADQEKQRAGFEAAQRK